MKIAIFSTHAFEKPFLTAANQFYQHKLEYFDINLSLTSVVLAKDFLVVSCFVTDQLKSEVLQTLAKQGTKMIALSINRV